MYLIIVYDISDTRIQTHVRNFLRRYLFKMQLSVFEGEVSPAQLREIKEYLKNIEIKTTDSIIIYKLRDQSKVEKIYFGKQYNEKRNIF